MAALTQARLTVRLGEETSPLLWKLPVAANVKIYAGSLVMIDAGYAKPAATATGKLLAGRAAKTVDNTGGAAGALLIEVERGTFKWANAGDIAQANVGAACYATDDQTVTMTTTGRSMAGMVYQVDSDGVFVVTAPLLAIPIA